jgi:hypothetical protein
LAGSRCSPPRPGHSKAKTIHPKEFAYRSLADVISELAALTIVAFNGLISGHLALKVQPQVTHSIVLKKKVTTTY